MEMKGQSQQQPLRQTAKEVIAAHVKALIEQLEARAVCLEPAWAQGEERRAMHSHSCAHRWQ